MTSGRTCRFSRFRGGNRANLPGYFGGTTNGGGRVLPQANRNDLASVQDDLSKTMGRHNLKTGVYIEYSSKTEPNLGSNYLGNFNFGSTSNNPLDTGYGYSNALLGIFQSYTESTNRANPDLRQWEVESYIQDNWRMNSRFTLDYGLRVYHVGPFAEITDANAGFFPELYSAAKAGRLYRPICLTGVSGDQACAAAQQRAIDPVTGQILSIGYQNNIVPGSGDPVVGMKLNGRNRQGRLLRLSHARAGSARRVCLGRDRRRENRGARVDRHFLQPARQERVQRVSGQLAHRVRQSHSLRDHFGDSQPGAVGGGEPGERRRHRAREARPGARLRGQRHVPARHRLPHGGGSGVRGELRAPRPDQQGAEPDSALRLRGPGEPVQQQRRSTRISCARNIRATDRS